MVLAGGVAGCASDAGPTSVKVAIQTTEPQATSLTLTLTLSGAAPRRLELLGGAPAAPPSQVSVVLPDASGAVGLVAVLVGSQGTRTASTSLTSRAHHTVETTLVFDQPVGDLGTPTYRDAVLASMPTSYYRLDEPSGTAAVDSVGMVDAAYQAPNTRQVPSLVGGDGNTALSIDFDGGVLRPGPVDVTGTTLELLFEPLDFNNDIAGIFYDEEYLKSGFRIGATQLGGVILWTNESGGTRSADRTLVGPVLLGTAHHVAITFAPSIATIYVDGRATFSGDPGMVAPTRDLRIGQLDGMRSKCIIDEAAVYPRVLSAAEITAHVDAWKAGK